MGKDCKYCGAYIADSLTVCPSCGRKVRPEKKPEYDTYDANSSAGAAAREESQSEYYDYGRSGEYDYGKSEEKSYDEAGDSYRYAPRDNESCGNADCHSRAYGDGDVEENKAISVLCYFGPLFLIPYLTRQNSDFVRFHSNQGLLLLIAEIVLGFIGLDTIGAIYAIWCMVKGIKSVLNGEKNEIPFIGSIRLLK